MNYLRLMLIALRKMNICKIWKKSYPFFGRWKTKKHYFVLQTFSYKRISGFFKPLTVKCFKYIWSNNTPLIISSKPCYNLWVEFLTKNNLAEGPPVCQRYAATLLFLKASILFILHEMPINIHYHLWSNSIDCNEVCY